MKPPDLRENVSLAPLTTFQIGGPARYFIHAEKENTVLESLDFASERQLPVFVLGGGSNLLISDDGFPGLVLHVGIPGIDWSANGTKMIATAGAGEDWDRIVAEAVARNLSGVECLSGIPGSVGGTPVQNVGAYGQEVAEVIVAVRALDREAQRIVELPRQQCGFSYRTSIFNSVARDRYVVLSVTFALTPNGAPAIRYPDIQKVFADGTAPPTLKDVREAVRHVRAGKAMLLVDGDPDCRSAGSFFKNPVLSLTEFEELERRRPDERVPRYRREMA